MISPKPFRLDRLITDCDMAVGYAGPALTAGMLMAGVPLLLLPGHLEQFLLATRVADIGAGIAVNPDAPPPDYQTLIRVLLESPSYRDNAQRFANKYAGFSQSEQQESIVTKIEEIAARKQVEA